ncbi:DUF928 domain-containing protein [Leptolyngbyaceae cyanobacterium UHCC 1019]
MISIPISSQASPSKNLPTPPRTGTPTGNPTPNGGSRPEASGGCRQMKHPVTALVKTGQDFTLSEKPTLWFYIPYTTAEVHAIEFSLHNAQQTKTLYRTTIQAPATPGIIAVPTQPNTSLKIGEKYYWKLILDCQAKKEADIPDLSLDGWVQRLEMPANFAKQLQFTPAKARTQQYLDAGGWYDALTHLAKLRSQNSQDANLQQQWSQLLKSAGWDNLTDQPLIEP